jgi:hypothetical protein
MNETPKDGPFVDSAGFFHPDPCNCGKSTCLRNRQVLVFVGLSVDGLVRMSIDSRGNVCNLTVDPDYARWIAKELLAAADRAGT